MDNAVLNIARDPAARVVARMVAITATACLLSGPPAQADLRLSQPSGSAGCVSRTVEPCIRPPTRLDGDVVVTGDGRHVYAYSYRSDEDRTSVPNAIVAFSRDAFTGELRPVECIADRQITGCEEMRELPQIGDIAISSDGQQLYVADSRSAAITTLIRDSATGRLSFGGCDARAGAKCGDPEPGAPSFTQLGVSPRGDLVALSGVNHPFLAIFRRKPVDGRLASLHAPAAAAADAEETVFSRDGTVLFVALDGDFGRSGGLLALTSDGSRRISCYSARRRKGCVRVRKLRHDLPLAPALSPDGNTLYTVGDRLLTFSVRSGRLALRDCVSPKHRDGCRRDRLTGLTSSLAVQPDGRGALSVVQFGSIVSRLRRGPRSGRVVRVSARTACVYGDKGTFGEIIDPGGRYPDRPPCQRARALTFPSSPEISPDGRHAYVSSVGGIAVLRLSG